MIQIEDVADKPPQEQRFGLLFVQMEEAFQVYEPFCANYQAAQDIVQQESTKLQKLSDILNPTYELPSMLIKPVQRICKYPLLLSQLIKATDKDWPHYTEMTDGLESVQRVTSRVNEVQRQYENLQIVEDLKRRVEDWKVRIGLDSSGTRASHLFYYSMCFFQWYLRLIILTVFYPTGLCCRTVWSTAPSR